MRNGGLARDDWSADIDVKKRVDVIQRDVLDVRQPEDPRIVDEDVEPAQLGDRLLDRGLDGGDICAIGLDGAARRPSAWTAWTTSAAASADFS